MPTTDPRITVDPHSPLEPAAVPYTDLFRLDGARFAIIGGGGGIGEHVARTLHSMGAELLIADVDADGVGRVGRDLNAQSLVADVSTEDGARAVRVAAGDCLDGFVDVVGQMNRKPLREFTQVDWQRDFQVNLTHAFLSSQHLAPLVARQGGSIVFISSVNGARAGRKAPGYGPAKAALEIWVKQLAAEYGPDGVRVNAVAPGLFLSPRVVARQSTESIERNFAGRTMLRRLGQPYEIAATVGFLLSPAAGYITASVISVEGGALSTDSTGLDEVPFS